MLSLRVRYVTCTLRLRLRLRLRVCVRCVTFTLRLRLPLRLRLRVRCVTFTCTLRLRLRYVLRHLFCHGFLNSLSGWPINREVLYVIILKCCLKRSPRRLSQEAIDQKQWKTKKRVGNIVVAGLFGFS